MRIEYSAPTKCSYALDANQLELSHSLNTTEFCSQHKRLKNGGYFRAKILSSRFLSFFNRSIERFYFHQYHITLLSYQRTTPFSVQTKISILLFNYLVAHTMFLFFYSSSPYEVLIVVADDAWTCLLYLKVDNIALPKINSVILK